MALFDDIGGDSPFTGGSSLTSTDTVSNFDSPLSIASRRDIGSNIFSGGNLGSNISNDTGVNIPSNSGRRDVDISGNIIRPGIGQLWPYIFTGSAAAVENARTRLINKQAMPVVDNLLKEGAIAAQNQDWDRVDQVNKGWANLTSQAPQFASLAQKFMNETTKRKEQVETNKAILDFASNAVPDNDKEAQKKIGALQNSIGKFSSAELQNIVEKAVYPKITLEKGWAQVTNPTTGATKSTALPIAMSPETMSPVEKQAFNRLGPQMGMSLEKFSQIGNAINSGNDLKGITGKDVSDFYTIRQGMFGGPSGGAVGQAQANALLSPSEQMKSGIPKDIVTGITNTGPIGQQQGIAPSINPQQLNKKQISQGLMNNAPTGIMPGTEYGSNTNFNNQQKPQITVDEAMKYFPPNTSQEQVQQTLNTVPEIANSLAQRYNKEIQSIQDVNERAKAIQRHNEALDTYAKEEAQTKAKTANEPTGEAFSYSKIDSNGNIAFAPTNAKRSDVSQGFYKSADASETPGLRDYMAFKGQAKAAFDAVKDATPDQFSAVNRILASGMQLPIGIPGVKLPITVNIPGMGPRTMGSKEIELYNQLSALKEAANITMPGWKQDSKNIETMMQALTGATATKDTALSVIKSTVQSGANYYKGRMSSTPGAAANKVSVDKDFSYTPSPEAMKGLSQKVGETPYAQQYLGNNQGIPLSELGSKIQNYMDQGVEWARKQLGVKPEQLHKSKSRNGPVSEKAIKSLSEY